MAKTTQKATEQKKEFNMEQVFAVWKHKAKTGKTFLSGTGIIGFYNTNKKNPKEPDVRFYETDREGKAKKAVYCSMWSNKSEKTGKTYLSGKLDDGTRVVGFVYQGTNEKAPYLSVYYSLESESQDKESENVFEPLVNDEEDLPF